MSRWHDAGGMRLVQGVAHLPGDLQHGGDVQRPTLDPLAEWLAFHELHHNEEIPSLLADVEGGGDGGRSEGGCRLCLTEEPSASVGIVAVRRRDELESDLTSEAGIASAKDLAHAAGTQPLADLVVLDGAAGRGHGVWSRVGPFHVTLRLRPEGCSRDMSETDAVSGWSGALRGVAPPGRADPRARRLPARDGAALGRPESGGAPARRGHRPRHHAVGHGGVAARGHRAAGAGARHHGCRWRPSGRPWPRSPTR